MALLILLFVAIILGYLLAKSKYRKDIDQTVERATTASRSWTEQGISWFQSSVLKSDSTSQVITNSEEQAPAELSTQKPQPAPQVNNEAEPAEKRPSRRKRSTS